MYRFNERQQRRPSKNLISIIQPNERYYRSKVVYYIGKTIIILLNSFLDPFPNSYKVKIVHIQSFRVNLKNIPQKKKYI